MSATYAQPNSYERLHDWTTAELQQYVTELLTERSEVWCEPHTAAQAKRLTVLEQLLSDVRDVLWLRTCAAWRAEEVRAA